MATTHVSPASFAQTKPDLGHSYVFAAEKIREEITERLNILDLGIVDALGDVLSQSGTDIIRITRFGGLGFAERMTAMGGETDPIVATGFTTDYSTATIGRYGIAKSETYQGQILNRPDAPGLGLMMGKVVESWLATLRYQVCVTGATVSTSLGGTGTAWTFDDELDLTAAFGETEGYEIGMPVYAMRHPEAYSDLRESLRNEPAYQFPEVMSALQGLRGGGGAFDFLGIRNFASWDVQASGGDHVGFAYAAGALVWVAPSTVPVRVKNPDKTMYVPEFGIVIEEDASGNTATSRFDANAWFGVALLPATLAPQFKLLSIND